MFRLNIPVLEEQLETWNRENERAIFTESSEWPLLSLCGYHADFGQNLAVFIGLTAILAVILAFSAVISIPRKGVRRCSAWVCNFSLRFIYELLFEILLCMLIHFKLLNQSDGGVGWALALIYLVLVTGIIFFLFTRLCYGGPTLNHYYGTGTLI